MPIYEYQCQSCGEMIEVLQKLSDPPLVDCTACGKPDLRKKVSAAAFRLKGGGWYETDFKTGDKKNLAAAPEKKDAGSAGGSDKPGGSGEGAKAPKETKSDTKHSA